MLALVGIQQEWPARSLESILSPAGFAVLRAATGEQVLQKARSERPDVLILDATLPDMDGLELCRALRDQHLAGAATPVILALPGAPTRDQRLTGLRAGAWDVVGFPLDAEEFILRIATYTDAKTEADEAREEGLLDIETGLYNMRGLLRRVRELGSEALRHRRPLACIVISPETPWSALGRDGEAAPGFSEVVRILQSAGRLSDAFGRIGDSELVVLAPETDHAGALRLAERLTAAAEEQFATLAGDLPAPQMRAGCYAVGDFHEAAIEPVEMLVRATMALRSSLAGSSEDRIQFFNAQPSWSGLHSL